MQRQQAQRSILQEPFFQPSLVPLGIIKQAFQHEPSVEYISHVYIVFCSTLSPSLSILSRVCTVVTFTSFSVWSLHNIHFLYSDTNINCILLLFLDNLRNIPASSYNFYDVHVATNSIDYNVRFPHLQTLLGALGISALVLFRSNQTQSFVLYKTRNLYKSDTVTRHSSRFHTMPFFFFNTSHALFCSIICQNGPCLLFFTEMTIFSVPNLLLLTHPYHSAC